VKTSCRSVVHVGDSTSVGLASAAYLPEARYRMSAQYRDIGVRHVHLDISGARSIVETYHGEPNAFEATQRRIEARYDGCYVIAMGTNDTANQYVGGVVPLADRIDRVMDELHGQPAMWLTVRTRLSSGPWAEAEMQKWNAALMQACRRYPRCGSTTGRARSVTAGSSPTASTSRVSATASGHTGSRRLSRLPTPRMARHPTPVWCCPADPPAVMHRLPMGTASP
jgi:hypothetical protein